MKAAMRAANPTKGRSKGSKGSSDNLDRMGNGGKPVMSRKDTLDQQMAAMDAIDQQMAEMERKSSELVKNLDSTSAQLDASDRASRRSSQGTSCATTAASARRGLIS